MYPIPQGCEASEEVWRMHASLRGGGVAAACTLDLANVTFTPYPVADPGFPVGEGRGPISGVWTSDAGAFWQKCLRK